MTIVISDYRPAADETEKVRFPGSKKTYDIPTSSALTIRQLKALAKGDIDALLDVFSPEVRAELENLHPSQLNDFLAEWIKTGTPTGTDEAPKD